MKNINLSPTGARLLKSTKIEIFSELSEKFGSDYGVPEVTSKEQHKINFKLDRLFSIIHDN